MIWSYGKIILFGEHAVVHGHTALAAAIDRGVRCHAQPAAGPSTLTIEDWNLHTHAGDGTDTARALASLVEACGWRDGIAIVGESTMPAGVGLGSSAALCVAIVRAIVTLRGQVPTPTQLQDYANHGEAVFHRNPSGVDVALASSGGLGTYTREAGYAAISAPPLCLAIGLSGQPRRTSDMVQRVSMRLQREPHTTQRLLGQLGALATQGAHAIATQDAPGLGARLHQAHGLLSELGVSTPHLDRLVDTAMTTGALGAKLTGAGGGGAVIALAPGREDSIVKRWSELGYAAFRVMVGVSPSTVS